MPYYPNNFNYQPSNHFGNNYPNSQYNNYMDQNGIWGQAIYGFQNNQNPQMYNTSVYGNQFYPTNYYAEPEHSK